jgi:hypothetical protein
VADAEEEAVWRRVAEEQAELDALLDGFYDDSGGDGCGDNGGDDAMGPGAVQTDVVCPMCSRGTLTWAATAGVYMCLRCRGFELDTAPERIEPTELRSRIGDALILHGSSGCHTRPVFSLSLPSWEIPRGTVDQRETREAHGSENQEESAHAAGRGGAGTMLLLQCPACSAVHVIV